MHSWHHEDSDHVPEHGHLFLFYSVLKGVICTSTNQQEEIANYRNEQGTTKSQLGEPVAPPK